MISFATITSYLRLSSPSLAGAEWSVQWKEIGFKALLSGMALLAIVTISGVIFILCVEAWPVLHQAGPFAFIRGLDWYPSAEQYSLLTMTAGTLAVSVGALLVAAPLGILCAILIQFYAANGVAAFLQVVLQLLAGIPSVVYGLWGLSILVPWLAEFGGAGPCLLAGVVVLTLMVLPTIAIIADASFRQQPAALYQGALALGLPRYRALLGVVLPAARPRLTAAAILGLARALGETMAVLMVTGNAINLPSSILSSVRTLAANIALEMAYALNLHRSALFATGLMLMLLVLLMLALANHIEGRGENND